MCRGDAAFYAASLGRTTPPLPVLQPLFTLKSPPEPEHLRSPSHLTCEAASALTELAGFPNIEHPFILPARDERYADFLFFIVVSFYESFII